MSALPRIAPRATPLPPSFGAQKPANSKPLSASIPTIYEVYPPRLPSAPDIPRGRINPLHPPQPLRRTVMLETKAPHFQNDIRAQRMKQREHYRYHNAWSKYYYGSAAEQESYRSYTRAVLKKQMEDADRHAKYDFKEKVQESVEATDRDNQTRIEDAMDFFRKYEYLKTFRDENKRVMESSWTQKRRQKTEENLYDREQMKYNPINWSCSLK